MSPVELRQLRYFLHLADELNFCRAAKKAHVSQSSVTEQLQRLEDVLGVRLVDRNRRRVRLTPAGEVLQQQTRKLFEQVGTLVERTREAGGISRQRLRIGFSEMAVNSPMPKIIQNFRRSYPDADTVLLEQSSSGSERALLNGVLDCLFVPNLQAHPMISSLTIGEDLILACLPESSPLIASPSVRIEQLRDNPVILPAEGSRVSDLIVAAFARADIRPNVVTRISRVSAMLAFAASEGAVCFITLSLAGLVPDGIVLRPFVEPALTVPFSLVWRNQPSNCAVDHFVAIARETIAPGANSH